jgi:hypothetical protein
MLQKLKILCFIFLFANEAHAQNYGSPMADSLIVWLQRLKNQDFNGIDKPNATPILGADKMHFENGNYTGYGEVYEDGAYISLKYLRSNKNSEKVYKKVKKAFTEILKDPAFLSDIDYDANYNTILKNNVPVLHFSASLKKGDNDENYLYLDIQRPIFPKIFMVNEAKYKGNFSTIINDTSEPQIWEVKGYNNGEWYQRYNGIFKDGILIKGSKTFKGYGDFYDGTWYAKEWGKHCEVVFFPTNSKDTVWGHFNDIDMNFFYRDERYSSNAKNAYMGLKPECPMWLKTEYSHVYQNQAQHDNIARNLIRKTDKDHLGLGKKKEEELAAINGIQQNLMLLIGTAALGYKSYMQAEKERSGESVFYYSKANPLMLSNEEVIESIGTKTNYIGAYRTKQTRDISMQAFLALPSTNKSSIALTLEQDKTVNATEVQQFNLYLADKLVASYAKYLKQELSVIKVYQLSF